MESSTNSFTVGTQVITPHPSNRVGVVTEPPFCNPLYTFVDYGDRQWWMLTEILQVATPAVIAERKRMEKADRERERERKRLAKEQKEKLRQVATAGVNLL